MRRRGTQGPTEYVLGTDNEEMRRLGLQHRLWRGVARAHWRRAGFRRAGRILDIGCGPGYAALDLARLAGIRGAVTAVDASPAFAAHLRSVARSSRGARIEVLTGDIERMRLRPRSFDAAYARWVLCFVPHPDRAVAAVSGPLRRGGVFAIQDYTHYLGMALSPASDAFDRAVAAVDASWRKQGGDPDIGLRLPRLLARSGFEIVEVRPLVRVLRPGTPLWSWPTTFLRSNLPRLVSAGFLSARMARQAVADWTARSRDPLAFFLTPPQVEIVARKK